MRSSMTWAWVDYGKTFTGTEKMWELQAPKNLIVCQKSKIVDWVSHVDEHYQGAQVFDLTKKGAFEKFLTSQHPFAVGVINYDLLIRRTDELSSLKDFTLMLDESSMIQNESAKRTKVVLKLKAKNLILLSGTPVGGKYERLWSQCKLLGWNISKTAFWERYINYYLMPVASSPFPIKQVTGYKNVDELKAKLVEHGAHFMKTEEVLSLPDQVFSTISVKAPKEYRAFMRDSLVEVDDVTLIGDNPLKKMLYARQLCSAYSDEKLSAFSDWVNSNDTRLIVFYNFNHELDELLKRVEGRPVSVVNGNRRDLTAYENDSDSITFVQYQAGAKGLNLMKANHLALFSPTLSVEDYMQCLKRIHRIGQTKTSFYYLFECKGSIEPQIYEALKRGEDFTLQLFDKITLE